MTWKEFKHAVEAQGAADDNEVVFIDWSGDLVLDLIVECQRRRGKYEITVKAGAA